LQGFDQTMQKRRDIDEHPGARAASPRYVEVGPHPDRALTRIISASTKSLTVDHRQNRKLPLLHALLLLSPSFRIIC
jgi:hypothetical protein